MKKKILFYCLNILYLKQILYVIIYATKRFIYRKLTSIESSPCRHYHLRNDDITNFIEFYDLYNT